MSRVVVKCDGLVNNQDIETKNKQDHEQMINLNARCIVGYYGSTEHCELIVKEYIRLANAAEVDINTLRPTTVIYDLCEVAKAMKEDKKMVSFLAAGIENGKIVLIGFVDQDNYEISNFSPVDERHITFITLGSETIKSGLPYTKFHTSDKNIESSMNQYIRYASTLDSGINDHIFTRKLKVLSE
jgi:hypothetical protein